MFSNISGSIDNIRTEMVHVMNLAINKITAEPTNGDIRLVKRYLIFPKTLYGVKRRGWQSVYQAFDHGYVNYEEFHWNGWTHHCWEDQPERLI